MSHLCQRPDRDVPGLFCPYCGHPRPCPHHAYRVRLGEAADIERPPAVSDSLDGKTYPRIVAVVQALLEEE